MIRLTDMSFFNIFDFKPQIQNIIDSIFKFLCELKKYSKINRYMKQKSNKKRNTEYLIVA